MVKIWAKVNTIITRAYYQDEPFEKNVCIHYGLRAGMMRKESLKLGEFRPYNSLGNPTPTEYAAQLNKNDTQNQTKLTLGLDKLGIRSVYEKSINY